VVRGLKWIAALCFLSLPVIAFLGRPIQTGCDPPLDGPCDPIVARPEWFVPLFWSFVLVGVVCLLVAFIVAIRLDSDDDLI